MKKHRGLNLQPQGAYVDLPALQQLRHLAAAMPSAATLARASAGSGRHHSRALSRGMEFEEVRLYQPGDDVRNIDWRVTARTQATYTKRYRDEKEKPVLTLVDQRRSLFFGSQHCFKAVYACHLAALINWSTLKRGDRAGGLVLGTHSIQESRPGRSQLAVNRWLQQLQQHNSQLLATQRHQEPSLADALRQLQRIAHTGTECILISDYYDLDEEATKLLYQLHRHNHLSLYWLTDPLEKNLPNIPQLNVSNGQDKATLSLNQAQRQQHQQAFLKRQAELQQVCRQYGIPWVEVDVQQPLTAALTLPGAQT